MICKFVNRKFAYAALVNGRNLRDAKIYDEDGDSTVGNKIYINSSLCPEFGYLHYAVRNAKKKSEIHSYKVKHGVMFIKKSENSELCEISHVKDLERYNLTVPVRRY